MKFLELLEEAYQESNKELVDKKILKLWTDSTDIEDIMKISKKSKTYIKNLLKKAGRKGWEEL